MAGKQRDKRTQPDLEEAGGSGVLVHEGSDGEESPAAVMVGRVVGEATLPMDGKHRSVSSEGGGGVAAPGGAPVKGEVENVAGYEPPLALEAPRAALEYAAETDDGEPLLDAWYAEFGDPRLAVLARTREVRDALEVVIPPDDRVQITDTTVVPWRWICALRITAANGSQFIGTGWLVGPRTVITAGHCVFMHAQGGWARQIEVVPGRNGASRPFGSCTATSFRSVSGWTAGHDRDFDYGAILLPSTCRPGDQLGFFGFAALNDAELLNLSLNLSGYPGDKPAGTQWFMARRATSVTARTIVYNIDTAGGQSGAPVWRLSGGVRHAVGIHTNGSLLGNSATRIVPDVAANIAAWKAAAP
jgi:glutamyl endopeptidase